MLAWRVGLGGMRDEGMLKEGVVGDGEGEVDMAVWWDRRRDYCCEMVVCSVDGLFTTPQVLTFTIQDLRKLLM